MQQQQSEIEQQAVTAIQGILNALAGDGREEIAAEAAMSKAVTKMLKQGMKAAGVSVAELSERMGAKWDAAELNYMLKDPLGFSLRSVAEACRALRESRHA